MASVLDIIRHYQQAIEKYSEDEGKVLRCIDKLFQLRVTVQHLQETGVGRTVNALRKEPGEVGQAARALVLKWKTMVAAEESDQEADPRNDTSSQNGHGSGREPDDHTQQSRSTHDRDNRTKVSTPKVDQRRKPTETNGHHSGSKRKYHSSEEEDHDAKKMPRHSSSDDDKKQVIVKKEKLSDSDSSDSESSDSDSDSYTSESSQEEGKVKDEVKQEVKKERKESPDRHRSSSSKHSHSNHDHKQDLSSSKKHESDKHTHHKATSKDISRQSSESSSKSSSHKHKHSDEKENADKRHKSDTSSDEKKESKSSSKHSSEKHKSSSYKLENSSERHKSSDKQSSKEHKSSLHTDKAPEKHKISSEKDDAKHKSKENSSSKEKHSSSSKEKLKERSSSSKERSSSSKDRSSHSHSSEKKHSSSDSKSQNSDKSKHKSDDSSSEKKSKQRSSSSSSHKNKSSSSSKSKEDVPKKKSKMSNSEDSGEDGIDCGSGASFAEALGMMISPSKAKKKSSQIRDSSSPNNSFINDLSPAALLAPTAKLAPLPTLEISALPEISPNYKPRPPPKFVPHFSDEDAISAGISSKNQRTKVYSGNKVIGKITSLYEMCVQVLQEHIDALEYTGGVPYEILKPVVDRATPQQLFLLEHYNPYLMEDTDHLWQKFCEKNFRNKRRQELESWREMYMRCQEEQESKLKSLTANIRLTQEAKKAPIKQTKMAYVDSVVKPPRNIARKQAVHGTAHAATASPAARVASLSSSAGVLRAGSPRPPAGIPGASSFKPKKAPLMQKALQFMRGRKR